MVFQGDRPRAEDNYKLGEFLLKGIRVAKKGEVTIIVSFNVDENALLTVKAYE
jgi:L1 cell adhesion molecule like protein